MLPQGPCSQQTTTSQCASRKRPLTLAAPRHPPARPAPHLLHLLSRHLLRHHGWLYLIAHCGSNHVGSRQRVLVLLQVLVVLLLQVLLLVRIKRRLLLLLLLLIITWLLLLLLKLLRIVARLLLLVCIEARLLLLLLLLLVLLVPRRQRMQRKTGGGGGSYGCIRLLQLHLLLRSRHGCTQMGSAKARAQQACALPDRKACCTGAAKSATPWPSICTSAHPHPARGPAATHPPPPPPPLPPAAA
jgi:hypothetical protein